MKRNNFILTIFTRAIEIFRKWDVYSKSILIFGLLFTILFLIVAVGYLIGNKKLIYVAIVCILLDILYAIVAFVWVMVQDTSMILPLVVYLIILIPINLYIFFHLKARAAVNFK